MANLYLVFLFILFTCIMFLYFYDLQMRSRYISGLGLICLYRKVKKEIFIMEDLDLLSNREFLLFLFSDLLHKPYLHQLIYPDDILLFYSVF